MKEFEIFKERAQEFIFNAKNSAKRKKYDVAIFNLEQAVQLFLKYLLGKKLGDFPKTHSIIFLLREIGKAYSKEKFVEIFIKENISNLEFLESAYINTRYLPHYWSKEHWKEVLSFFNKIKSFLKKITNENIG